MIDKKIEYHVRAVIYKIWLPFLQTQSNGHYKLQFNVHVRTVEIYGMVGNYID